MMYSSFKSIVNGATCIFTPKGYVTIINTHDDERNVKFGKTAGKFISKNLYISTLHSETKTCVNDNQSIKTLIALMIKIIR